MEEEHNISWDEYIIPFLPVLERYSKLLANDMISPEDVISIAFWRVIKYKKHTPDKLWVPLCKHIREETRIRRSHSAVAPGPEEKADESSEDNKLLLEDLMRPLSKSEAWLLWRYYGDGYTYEELGGALKVSWMTVRNRIRAAIEKIRSQIGE